MCVFALAACRPPLRVPPSEATPESRPTNAEVNWRIAAGDPASPGAQAVMNALQLALEENNGGSLCAGKVRISIVAQPMPVESDPPAALRGVREAAFALAKDSQSWLMITSADSAAVRVILPEAGAAGGEPIPVIGLSAAAIGLTQPGNASEPEMYYPIGRPNFIRLTADDGARASVMALWAVSKGAQTVAVIGDARRPEITDAIAARLKPLAVKLQRSVGTAETVGATAAIARDVVTANPDLVYFGGESGTAGGQFAAALRTAGYRGRLGGGQALLSLSFAAAAGAAAEGALTTESPMPSGPFAANFEKRFRVAPTALASRAYDAAKAAFAATQRVCETPTRDAFRRALLATKHFAGASGTWSVAPNGDTQPAPVVVVGYAGGAWAPVP